MKARELGIVIGDLEPGGLNSSAETMTGRAGATVHGLEPDRLLEVMRRYGR